MIALETGAGRPLIALHGFGVDHRIMLPLEQMTSGMPWRRIYIDLPWTPAATATASSAREVAAGVLAEIDEHLKGEPFAVIGNQDDVVGYEDGLALRAHDPRGSFVVVDGAGHNVHLERPELTGAAVRDWLDRMDGEAAP